MDDQARAVRVLIADHHPIFHEGLHTLLTSKPGFEVVGRASNAADAIRLAREVMPDVVLFDFTMPGLDRAAALRQLAATWPARIVVLTGAIERPQVIEALQLGARGVVTKETTPDLLFESIRCVMAGEYWVGRQSVSDLVQYVREYVAGSDAQHVRKNNFGLTRRETQIVSTVVAGYTNKDIAQRFSLSEDTVKHHLSNIFDKVGVSNRLELAVFAMHHRLTGDEQG